MKRPEHPTPTPLTRQSGSSQNALTASRQRTTEQAARFSQPVANRAIMLVASFAVAMVMMVGLGASPAAAASTQCYGSSRCAVYLDRNETLQMARGNVGFVNRIPHPVLRVAAWSLVFGHKWIAQQYYNQGRCGVFLLSLIPWDNKGFSSYRC